MSEVIVSESHTVEYILDTVLTESDQIKVGDQQAVGGAGYVGDVHPVVEKMTVADLVALDARVEAEIRRLETNKKILTIFRANINDTRHGRVTIPEPEPSKKWNRDFR